MDAEDVPTTRDDPDVFIVELDGGPTVIFTRDEDGYPIEGEAISWDGPVIDLDV